ncbi:MAG: MBL fold metallo-hydrolase [Nitrososphaeraceae archaeon]|nr:MBL fold metallo-hydrolase [Nitrososphaeraceae archaeon]MBV9667842.1 MBL fold metallo-hydrolase [Nitrososphaeraceae archaeon]
MKLKIIQIPVGQMANFSYVIADEESSQAAIIDPSWDLEKIFDLLKRNKWIAKYIVNTHTHFDHVLGNEQVAEITGAPIVQHKSSNLIKQVSVSDGDIIKVGNVIIKTLHTPGHSQDSICLVVNDEMVFTGDTLFVGNCGRVDLPGSNPRDMYNSLFQKVAKLKDSLIMYPGHDYGPHPTSTIGQEKKTNYVLQPRSLQEFLGFMASDD